MPIVGLGVDLVDSIRVGRLIARNEDIFRNRILGHSERLEISTNSARPRRVLAYSCCIAAKEAFLKALGTGLMGRMRWPEIEIVERSGLKPRLKLSGEAARALAHLKADTIQLSISAPQQQVLAIVMLTRNESLGFSL